MTASDRQALHARWHSTLAFESGLELERRPVTDATCLATTLECRHPRVLLLDKALLDRLDPLSLRRIQRCLDVRVLLVAEQASHSAIADVLRNRFRGLLLTTSPPYLFLKAIRAVSKGELWLSRRVMAQLITDIAWPLAAADAGASADADGTHAMDTLSRRESQVVAQLQRGCSNKEIARELGIMEDTVKKHLKSIFAKLGVHRRSLVALQASAAARPPGIGGQNASGADTRAMPVQGLPAGDPAPLRHAHAADTQSGQTSARPHLPLQSRART